MSRALRWLSTAVVAIAAALLTARAVGPIHDPDAWWHLRLGADLVGRHSLSAPARGPFATRPWTPSEPLPEVLAIAVERGFGLPGLAVLYGAALLALLAVGWVVARRLADPLPAAIAVVAALTGAAGSLTQRPQLVSFALLVVVVGAWLATHDDLRARWWLLPTTWFWSMCHGFWFLGVAVSLVCWVGLVLDRRRELDVRGALRLL